MVQQVRLGIQRLQLRARPCKLGKGGEHTKLMAGTLILNRSFATSECKQTKRPVGSPVSQTLRPVRSS